MTDVQFGPGARIVLSASRDRTARLWDAETGRMLLMLKHGAPVVFARFSPDGSRIVTSTCPDPTSVYDLPSPPGLLHVWDARTGRELWWKKAWTFGGWVHFAIRPDGRRVAFFSVKTASQSLLVCDLESGEQTAEHDVPRQWIQSLTYSPDGRLLASSYSSTRFVRVWDGATGRATDMDLDGAAQVDATFSPDGTRVLSAGLDGAASVWDAATGALLLRTPADARKRDDAEASRVPTVAFSPDGSRIAVSSRATGETTLWDVGQRAAD